MELNKEIVILQAYRPFVTYFTVYSLDNFRNIDRRTLFRHTWRAVGVTIAFAVFVLIFLLPLFVVCYQHRFDLNVIIEQLAFAILGLPAMPIYLVMFWKSEKVINVVASLNEAVVESKRKKTIFTSFFLLTSLDKKCKLYSSFRK